MNTQTQQNRRSLCQSQQQFGLQIHTLPPIVPPKGHSAERQWYLFDTIREFCPDIDKDLTCPLPAIVCPTSSAPGTPARTAPSMGEDYVERPSKRRRCGIYREGHNSRSCPNKET